MAKRRKLRLSRTAEADLEKIDFFSFEKWSEAVAQAYMAEIEARLKALCEAPFIGVDRSDLRAGYRAVLAGRHIIYYYADDEFINVLTILHHSRDQEAFLEEIDDC